MLVTIIFWFFIASISTESKPTPNLEIIFNLQLELETQFAFALGKLRSIASNDLENIGDISTLADPSIVKKLIK